MWGLWLSVWAWEPALGAILHIVSISKRKFHPSPPPLPHAWAVSQAQIDTGLTRDPCRHSPMQEAEVGINTCKNFQILNFKKGKIGRLMLTTLDLWKSRGIGHDVFFWKCKGWSLDIVIDNDPGRGNDLCLRVFKKVWSFTHFGRRLGIRSVSGIQPTFKCRCPPRPQELWYITQ
jgi:hypothetical protein